jgi:hypothetical protein
MYTKPVLRAAAVYEQEECPRTFAQDLEAHLLHGLVISKPELFFMARPVSHDATGDKIVNPWVNTWDKEPDCWHVYLYAGDLLSAFQQVHELPFVSFEKRNRLRVYQWGDIYAACSRNSIVS